MAPRTPKDRDQEDLLAELRRTRNELVHGLTDMNEQLAHVDELIARLEDSEPGEESTATPEKKEPRPPRRPVRTKVLDALDDIGWPTYARQLSPYIEARYGDRIPSSRFGVLARDEQARFKSRRAHTIYISFCITYDRGEAIKRLLARSDMPLEQRIVAPTTGRVQHLKLTARLCEIAQEVGTRAANPDKLRYLAADHARDLPGVTVRRGRFELARWREVAEAELERLLPRDEAARREAAAQFESRPEFMLLFGMPEVVEGDADAIALRGRA